MCQQTMLLRAGRRSFHGAPPARLGPTIELRLFAPNKQRQRLFGAATVGRGPKSEIKPLTVKAAALARGPV